MTKTDAILVTRGLGRSFGGFHAVRGVDLEVQRGTVHAVIGPNGAGKTTCFNLLTKFLQPSAGTIHYNGRDITRMRAVDVARLGMVRSFQISAVFGGQTVHENVRVAIQRRERGASFDFWRSKAVLAELDDEADELLVAVGLTEYRNTRAAELSYGRKRSLELATTLALRPELMLLDEPMAGMGHEDIERVTALIQDIARDRTILMVEHNLSVVAQLSDMITVLARGEVLAEGTYDAVSNDPRVVEAYIGVPHE
jgi:branched-chain amino acid transport system ATP-binding protein